MLELIRKTFATTVLAAALAGCAMHRPTYGQLEEAPLPAQYGQIAAISAATPARTPDAGFWQQFDDPLLAQLVQRTLRDNLDLQVAVARLDRARALLRGQQLDRYPTVRAQAGASDARTSAADAPGATRADRDSERYHLGLTASWELDLFARVRRGIEARGAELAASAADVEALKLVLTGALARTYLELRGLQTRLQVATDNASNQQQTLKLVQARLDVGVGTDFDLVRARSQLEATRARIPALQAQVARAMHRLAVLTGRSPAALLAELSPPRPLPAAPAALAAGTPGALLRHRPDIVAAEQRVAAASARIGVATADLFPRFTLAGLLGTAALDSGALFERDSESRSIALGIDWSFLDRGRVKANIAAAEADTHSAVASYRQTVLTAMEDVENALVGYGGARQEDTHLSAAASDSERAAQLAHIRFDAGAINLLDVLDAERVRLQAQDQLADARTRSVVALVQLWVALGGGWQGAEAST